jgi:hypothetical protein
MNGSEYITFFDFFFFRFTPGIIEGSIGLACICLPLNRQSTILQNSSCVNDPFALLHFAHASAKFDCLLFDPPRDFGTR